MSAATTIRNRFVDGPDSLAERYRARRWEQLRTEFPDIADMTIVDLGGTVSSWRRAPVRPRKVIVLSFEPEGADDVDWIESHHADACDLPAPFRDLRADLVYSNAVIEHVGGAERRQRFADSVHRLADHHWVQTPYRYFPVEPHWLFPGFQFLPVPARVAVSRRWRLVHTPNSDRQAAVDNVLSVELIGLTELRNLFPTSRVLTERAAGLVKSIIAVR
ncbi:methyltransferase domain-containing protein [Aeromicrobium wangtongii]|uniref:Class I SAM-dependent methyltransferase n=1 Tax=Aeromicrobium wangtongii TaxID=2969247 RepID=A0ABY5M8C7_9ACTN|nr:methyltransferase domain-containing protein [Aeromicrobium wangtongii]MCD9196881.1 class I SAM-dependent methyltransferase [Aeromicrobium wangtongii]UUP14389.1 class I SAM-dependent methyltransferase [Aeromicrobium wangtongii]